MTKGSPAVASAVIDGLYTVPLRAFEDERGRFMETFRVEWFPQVDWTRVQGNRSDSRAGVLRGLHYHFHQVDYWYVTRGLIRVGLVDLRPSSPTFMASLTMDMSEHSGFGLFIPSGVAHGFAAIEDCTLTYTVNNYYGDGSDERGVAWDDPQFALDWGLDNPVLSPRDQQNRRYDDIPEDERPR
jgi:dTDP-4-dehydrorhamnose 3,5-epimerase